VSYVAMVYTFATAAVLGVRGIVLVSLGIWNQAKTYAKARNAMNCVLPPAESHGRFAISKTVSQPQNTGRSRAA
jgi:hypothetical protein